MDRGSAAWTLEARRRRIIPPGEREFNAKALENISLANFSRSFVILRPKGQFFTASSVSRVTKFSVKANNTSYLTFSKSLGTETYLKEQKATRGRQTVPPPFEKFWCIYVCEKLEVQQFMCKINMRHVEFCWVIAGVKIFYR